MFSFQISLNRTDHRQKEDCHADSKVRYIHCGCIELARVKRNYSKVHCTLYWHYIVIPGYCY